MEDKNIDVRTWRKIADGVSRLDNRRLVRIAEMLNISARDLVSNQKSVYIYETDNQGVGIKYGSKESANQEEDSAKMYERIIAEKDRIIEDKNKEITYLRNLIEKLS